MLNSSTLEWVPNANVSISETDWTQNAQAVLDSTYPEDVNNCSSDPCGYFCASFDNPTPNSPIVTVFKLNTQYRLAGIKIRGENYSDMRHMPKLVHLSCRLSPDDSWSEPVVFELRASRGWQMFHADHIQIADSQSLSDRARDPLVRGTGNHSPWLNPDVSSPAFKTNNELVDVAVAWPSSLGAMQSEDGLFCKVAILSNHGSYTALAEINFLVDRASPRFLNLCGEPAGETDVTIRCIGLDGIEIVSCVCPVGFTAKQLVEHLASEVEKTGSMDSRFEFGLPDGTVLQAADTRSLADLRQVLCN